MLSAVTRATHAARSRTHIHVVPAKAGTHTPCVLVFCSDADAFGHNQRHGYGSPRPVRNCALGGDDKCESSFSRQAAPAVSCAMCSKSCPEPIPEPFVLTDLKHQLDPA